LAQFGAALAGVGDINDDGVPDLAVGAPYQEVEDRDNAGVVFLVSGADGRHLHTLHSPQPQLFAHFGTALGGLGDVNGDGVPDLAIGAPLQDVEGENCCDQGQVVVVSGADGTRLHTLHSPRPQRGARFGAALAGVGDVNGDGVSDLAVGAPSQDVEGRGGVGVVFLVSGADGRHLHSLHSPNPQAGADFGRTLAGVGDVNGDGVPDLAVGDPLQDLEGDCCGGARLVFLFSGATGRHLHTVRAPRPQPEANFGAALAGVGDVNGDGVPDLAVGAPFQYVRGLENRGQVFVFSVSTAP
jgi:hypothetical protein